MGRAVVEWIPAGLRAIAGILEDRGIEYDLALVEEFLKNPALSEDCHVVMPKYANGTPRKDVGQRHNMTFKPQYNYVTVGGTNVSVINVTDCRYCHSFPDSNPDSPY